MTKQKKYWGFRIDKTQRDFIFEELNANGILRQGWGWDEQQDLRNMTLDKGAGRNLSAFKKVKKGDLLLVPRIPKYENVALVEATEDWSTGYKFNIHRNKTDYGHCFPAKLLRIFTRANNHVGGDIKETLKCRSRFWNVNRCQNSIETLLNIDPGIDDLTKISSVEAKYTTIVEECFNTAFDESLMKQTLSDELNNKFKASEWEKVLKKVFSELYPHANVTTTSNKSEAEHGADIWIEFPGILPESRYLIAIQIKDYKNIISGKVIAQIEKAKDYFNERDETLIDLFIIATRCSNEKNVEIIKQAKLRGVTIICKEELDQILLNAAKSHIGFRPEVFG